MLPKIWCWLFGHSLRYIGEDGYYYKRDYCPRCGIELKEGEERGQG